MLDSDAVKTKMQRLYATIGGNIYIYPEISSKNIQMSQGISKYPGFFLIFFDSFFGSLRHSTFRFYSSKVPLATAPLSEAGDTDAKPRDAISGAFWKSAKILMNHFGSW